MSAPTIEEFVKAVEVFTSTHDDDERIGADHWIQSLTKTVEAWEIADMCLQGNYSDDVHFFAAQIMKTKIQSAFTEVPEDAHESLRDALCASIGTLAGRAKRIAVQLALALADLAIQMWQVWEAPTEDLIGMFGSKPDTVIGLLEFLKVMPEEIGNPMLCLTHADREIVATRLGQNCVSVIPFLENCIEVYGHESSIVERTFACLDSWLRFGGQVTITFAHSPLLTACFEAVVAPDPILRDCACEAIVSALYLGRDSEHHPDLTPNLIGPSLALRPTFAAAAAENDFGLAQSVARVLVEVAEALVDPSLVTGSPTQEQMAAIEAIAEVAHYDDSDTVHLTFGFWYRFATEIYETSRRIQAAEDLDMFMDQFRSFFRDLYGCLLRLVRCEPEIEAVLDKDEELSDFRERAADLIVETSFILGAESAMEQLLGACQGDGVGWSDIEAALFMMSCRLAFGLKPDSVVAEQLLVALSTIDEGAHPQLRVTAVKLLGDLSRWATHHPEAVAKIWELLVQAMQEPSLRTPAIFSILRLCETARDNFTPHLEELISLVGQCDAVGLTHGDTSRLLRATAEVVAHQHPENMGAAFAALVLPIDNKLKADVGAGDSPIPALERLGEVFKWTNIPTKLTDGLGEHPLFGVCGDIFETLKAVMEHFASNKSVVEEANRSVKHMLRTLDEHALPMANAILHLTVKLFHAHHHPSCLYVTTGIVKSFGGRSEELTSIIMEAVQTLAEPTFALLGSTDDALVQHPELVDDLFRLLLQTLRIIPAAVYTAELGVPAFQLGAATMLLRHRTAHETATEFLRSFIGFHRSFYANDEERPRYLSLATELIEAEGAKLVESCIHAFLGDLPPLYHADCADVLFEIHDTAPEKCYELVRAVLESERLTNCRATEAQQVEFLQGFEKSWTRVVDFRTEVVKRFARIFTDYRNLDEGQ